MNKDKEHIVDEEKKTKESKEPKKSEESKKPEEPKSIKNEGFPTVQIDMNRPLYAHCGDGIIKINSEIYYDSDWSKKVCKIVPTLEFDKLYPGLISSMKDTNNTGIQVLEVPSYKKEDFVSGNISNFSELVEFLPHADEMLINMTRLDGQYCMMGFITSLFIKQLQVWNTTQQLLYNTEFKAFNIKKFVDNDSTQPVMNNGYDMPRTIKHPHNKEYNIIFKDDPGFILKQDEFDIAMEYLLKFGMTKTCRQLLLATILSHQNCHIAIRSPLLGATNDLFTNSVHMFYPLRILFLKEKYTYTGTKMGADFLLNLEHVSNFSKKFTCSGDFPYYPELTGTIIPRNALTMNSTKNARSKKIISITEFKERLKEFTCGELEKFTPELWKQVAVCGSAIACCAIYNEAEEKFHSFEEYVQIYYECSKYTAPKDPNPVPVTINNGSYIEVEESDPLNEDVNNDDSSSSSSSSSTLAEQSNVSDLDIMIEDEHFDEKAQAIFAAIKETNVGKNAKINKVDTPNKYKYTITGIPREIDLFSVSSIPGTIVKFHLNCVRAWYDGNQVWCFPSFVSACIKGLCTDLRWVSCNKDLRDIVIKYIVRGFSVILNTDDYSNIVAYISNKNIPYFKNCIPNTRVQHGPHDRWKYHRFIFDNTRFSQHIKGIHLRNKLGGVSPHSVLSFI